MASKVGTIWAQSVWWNSTYSSKSRTVVLAGPRDITAYSSISKYSFVLPGATKKVEPPLLVSGETGIAWYFTLDGGEIHRHPGVEGEFDPWLPYIQADNVTQLKFRLKAFLLGGDGVCGIRVVHVINYFQ
jgi:hypothetical protein